MLGNEKMYMTCLKIFSSISNASNYCQLRDTYICIIRPPDLVTEFYELIPLLVKRSTNGNPAFQVVAPTLPGTQLYLTGGRPHLARYTALPSRWSHPLCQDHNLTFPVIVSTSRVHKFTFQVVPTTLSVAQLYLLGGPNNLLRYTTLPSRCLVT